MKPKIWMLGLAMCLAMAPAFAGKDEVILKAQDKSGFATEAAMVRKQLGSGRYEYMTGKERDIVDSNLKDMQALFDTFGAADKMDGASKARLLSEQAATNEILARRDNNRTICERSAPTGSLVPKTTCRTYGDIERARRENQNFLQNTATQGSQNRGG